MALIMSTSLFAQAFSNDACYVVETDEGKEYVQRFEWQQIDYIQKFEFHLEMKDAATGLWTETECIETKDNHIEIPLDSGIYQYKIVVFNLLGKPELESEWIPLEINKVYQPKVDSVSSPTVYLEDKDGELTLSGKGLLGSSKLTLWNEEGIAFDVENLGSDDKFRELKLYTDPELLLPGVYTLTIENEGGLSTTFTPITVKYRKAWDLDVAVGYACVLNLFDSNFKNYFGETMFPFGAGAKISVMPIKKGWGYLGFGLNATYSLMNDLEMKPVETGYELSGNYIAGYFDIIYQYPIRNQKKNNNLRAIFEGHVGAGLVLLNDITFHFPHDINTEPFNILYLSAQFGGSAQYYLTKRLYVELNLDVTITPSIDMNMGNLVPTVMIGWQF
ncbi:MAG: hypothetical protein KBT02_04960 [Treponema sp.]|nr:hypothetical protein [Candidatus Treponema caballi]